MSYSLLVIYPLAALTCFGLLRLLTASPLGRYFMDQPNARSMHEVPVPRIGGMAIMATAFLLTAIALPYHAGAHGHSVLAMMLATAVLVVLGLADDRVSLSPLTRGSIHLLCALAIAPALLSQGGSPESGSWADQAFSSPLTLAIYVATLCWSANLYNFMDGSDGLAGIMAAIGFGALGAIAAVNPAGAEMAVIGFAIGGAACGFLVTNWAPARVFLGDSGSVPIGFLAGGLGLMGVAHEIWQPWVPIVIFLPFLMDASLTLLLRTVSGQKPWQAHRQHAYQRLILAGLSHQSVALIYGGLSLAATLVVATTRYQIGYVPFTLWTVIICANAGVYGWALKCSSMQSGR